MEQLVAVSNDLRIRSMVEESRYVQALIDTFDASSRTMEELGVSSIIIFFCTLLISTESNNIFIFLTVFFFNTLSWKFIITFLFIYKPFHLLTNCIPCTCVQLNLVVKEQETASYVQRAHDLLQRVTQLEETEIRLSAELADAQSTLLREENDKY